MKIYNIGPDELSDYDLKELRDDLEWLVVFYECWSYEGDGEAVGYLDGKLYFQNLGHCSCYGPTDGGFSDVHSIEEFKESLDSVHGFIDNGAVEMKVLELLG